MRAAVVNVYNAITIFCNNTIIASAVPISNRPRPNQNPSGSRKKSSYDSTTKVVALARNLVYYSAIKVSPQKGNTACSMKCAMSKGPFCQELVPIGHARALRQLRQRSLVFAALLSLALCHISFAEAHAGSRSTGRQFSAKDIQHLAEAGQRALAAGQYDVAERNYRQLLKVGVHSASLYSNLGVVYMRTARLGRAIQMFSEAKRLAPGVAGVNLNLGLAYFREHEFKKAAFAFADTLSLDPGNIQARYLAGECHFLLDEFSEAVADFEPLLSTEQNDVELLFMLGTSYGMLKRNEDSFRTFEMMVKSGGDTPHLHLLLGKAYLALGQNDKAAEELNRAAANDVPFAHYYLGVLHREVGNLELAQLEFERETQVDPANTMALNEVAEIRLDQADPRSAIAVLEKGIGRKHDSPELLGTLGRAYLEVQDESRSIAVLKKAIALSPSTGSYHYELGRAYLKAGRRAEAHRELERARALEAEFPQGKMEAFSREQQSGSTANGSQ
jgi:tetratricopeptide (TPR) repeat protein